MTVEHLEKLLAEATPRPWRCSPDPFHLLGATLSPVPNVWQDGELIAAAVNDLPALLEVVKAAEDESAAADEWYAELEVKGPRADRSIRARWEDADRRKRQALAALKSQNDALLRDQQEGE